MRSARPARRPPEDLGCHRRNRRRARHHRRGARARFGLDGPSHEDADEEPGGDSVDLGSICCAGRFRRVVSVEPRARPAQLRPERRAEPRASLDALPAMSRARRGGVSVGGVDVGPLAAAASARPLVARRGARERPPGQNPEDGASPHVRPPHQLRGRAASQAPTHRGRIPTALRARRRGNDVAWVACLHANALPARRRLRSRPARRRRTRA
jgi:hypothetical protein